MPQEHPTPQARARADSASPLSPMRAIQDQLTAMGGQPVSCCLADHLKQQWPHLDSLYSYGASADNSRSFFSYFVHNHDGTKNLIIDVWDNNRLEMIQRFDLPELARDEMGHPEREGMLTNIRTTIFLDNDHLLATTLTGHIWLLSISSGQVLAKKKAGYRLTAAAACQSKDIFAVSIFPDHSVDEYQPACGVKIFSLSAFVKGQELELSEFISPNLAEPPFSILPHTLQFDDSGRWLLFKGASFQEEGYCDYVEVFDLTDMETPAITIHARHNAGQMVEASMAANGQVAYTETDCVKFFDEDQQFISREELPPEMEEGCHRCRISEDGSQALIIRRGVVYLCSPDKPARRCLAELGCIFELFWTGPEEIMAFVSHYDSYQLQRIDMTTMKVVATANNPRLFPIEQPLTRALTVDHNGRIYSGDRQGGLRIYNLLLRQQSRLQPGHGPINHLVTDRFKNRVAILMASQRLEILDPADNSLSLYHSRSTSEPITAGYGIKSINYPLLESGQLSFDHSRAGSTFQWNDKDHFSFSMGGTYIAVRRFKFPKSGSYLKAGFTVSSPIKGACDCREQLILALADGSLQVVDPYSITRKIKAADEVVTLPDSICHQIDLTVIRPTGLLAVGSSRILVWNKSTVTLVKLAKDLTVTERVDTPRQGVRHGVYDSTNRRIILVMADHLAFYNLELQEMYRLYQLANGKGIIHVPYPVQLRDAGQENHPGYYWGSDGNAPDPGLFSVQDSLGAMLPSTVASQDFIRQQCCNEFMVHEALENYPDFVKLLRQVSNDPLINKRPMALSA